MNLLRKELKGAKMNNYNFRDFGKVQIFGAGGCNVAQPEPYVDTHYSPVHFEDAVDSIVRAKNLSHLEIGYVRFLLNLLKIALKEGDINNPDIDMYCDTLGLNSSVIRQGIIDRKEGKLVQRATRGRRTRPSTYPAEIKQAVIDDASGDTLCTIADRHGVPYQMVRKWRFEALGFRETRKR